MALSGFGQAKTAKEEVNVVQNGYPSPLITKINGLMEYSKSGKGSVSIHCRGPWFIKKLTIITLVRLIFKL